jgi:hypothetical protein
MAIKVKEIKDDALIDIKVNKTYYLMLKDALYFLYSQNNLTNEQKEQSLARIMNKEFHELDPFERAFQTITRMIGEIEKECQANDLYEEKEILEPGDEGYVEPTQD